jgi:hypothetical protein
MVDLYRLRGPSTYNISTREPVPTYMLIAAAEPEARSGCGYKFSGYRMGNDKDSNSSAHMRYAVTKGGLSRRKAQSTEHGVGVW